ncbi:MAG: hypothetical protein ACK4GT_19210, partial [Pararhodobacter sp.]
AERKFSNWRGFHLRKFPDEAARHWQIAVAYFADEVRSRRAAGEVIDLAAALPLAVAALRHADSEEPELRRLIMARFLWNRLTTEAREAFTTAYKRFDKGKGAEVMGRFCDMLYEQDLISFEVEMQGVPKDATEIAGPLMMDWLADEAKAKAPAKADQPPGEEQIDA